MPTTILEQIAAAKRGEQRAFSWLLSEFWQEVYLFQLKRLNNEVEAEDITIQTFERAFNKISTFNENYSFSTWLITISKNIYIDDLRKQGRLPLSLDSSPTPTIIDDTPTIEDSLIREQQLDYLLNSIKQLKDPYRTAIQLRYLQEKSYKEIAEITGNSMSNVKVILLRAKKILAEILKKNR